MANSFTHKQLSVTFALGTGSFGNSTATKVTLTNLRASASVIKAGGASMGGMQLRVWGMTLDKMNQLSTLGKLPMAIRNNTVSLSAGEAGKALAVVFEGTIYEAWSDFQAMPDNVFHVAAAAGLLEAVKPVPASSFRGATDAAVIMSGLATQMGLTFENTGVSVQLADPYFPGTAREQAQRCADAANINWIIDDGKLAIWPKGAPRGSQIPIVSPETGMIGYPTFTATGIVITTIYNPSLGYGNKVKVKSSIKPANGEWTIYTLAHVLESELPQGNWLTRFEAAPPGYVPVR